MSQWGELPFFGVFLAGNLKKSYETLGVHSEPRFLKTRNPKVHSHWRRFGESFARGGVKHQR